MGCNRVFLTHDGGFVELSVGLGVLLSSLIKLPNSRTVWADADGGRQDFELA